MSPWISNGFRMAFPEFVCIFRVGTSHWYCIAECHDMSCVSIIKSNVHSPKKPTVSLPLKNGGYRNYFPFGEHVFRGFQTTGPKTTHKKTTETHNCWMIFSWTFGPSKPPTLQVEPIKLEAIDWINQEPIISPNLGVSAGPNHRLPNIPMNRWHRWNRKAPSLKLNIDGIPIFFFCGNSSRDDAAC